ncbi:MAG: hypothetical protein OYH76_18245 [Defluviicoccus sp.]|nr:hypothetical protein [Defluviicoccus sp.]MDE0277840.1 hypothetical protein [Defluviicoccus sp.]
MNTEDPPKPDDLNDFMRQVAEATAALFLMLEGVELIASRIVDGTRKPPTERGFGPSSMSIGFMSAHFGQGGFAPLDKDTDRMAQLAYLGWVSAVDGAWEKYRTNPPYDKQDEGLRRGQEADLLGDFHKIRNDLLKNRGVAQEKNSGKCTILKWFEDGEPMRLTTDHVLDFLHKLGGFPRARVSPDGRRMVSWIVDKEGQFPPDAARIVSFKSGIEAIPEDEGGGFALFLWIVFADGIAWTVLVDQADSPDELKKGLQALREPPVLDGFGAPISPSGEFMDVRATYMHAREALLRGNPPSVMGRFASSTIFNGRPSRLGFSFTSFGACDGLHSPGRGSRSSGGHCGSGSGSIDWNSFRS